MEEIVQNRRWQSRVWPFPHIYVRDVFTAKAYAAFESSFQQIRRAGIFETSTPGKLARRMRGYDAYSLNLAHISPEDPLHMLTSIAWHDLLAAISGVEATGDVNAALHYHSPNSQNGTIHNDLNPAYFVDNPNATGINLSNNNICEYCTGVGPHGQNVREVVRAAAMIFYLANESWVEGNGGETGLYAKSSGPVENPDVVIPPINNSLLIFECTPYSFHSFIRNRNSRSSLILWLHRPVSTVVTRWGGTSIVKWAK